MRTIREYLYKAKTEMIVRSYNNGLDDGVWVKGYLRCDCGMWLIYQFEYDRADQVAYEVNPETICQFTGLKDRYGDKIWENDIVRLADEDVYIVTWEEDDAMFALEDVGVVENFGNVDSRWCEVIGNKFDNPDLI